MNEPARPLRRSTSDRMIAGVIGGLAEQFGLDSKGLRIAYVILSLLSAAFPGILVYVVCWLVIPQEED